MIVAVILNVNRAKDQKAFKPEDIMPWLRKGKGKNKGADETNDRASARNASDGDSRIWRESFAAITCLSTPRKNKCPT